MQLVSEDIEFLKELYTNKSVDLYFFHEKYMLSPGQLGRTIRKYINIGCVTLKGNNIELTENGRKWIITNRHELFLKGKKKYWKNIPTEMTQEVLSTKDTYMPYRGYIDPEIINNLEDGE